MIPRLKEQYYKTVVKNLSKKFQMKNIFMAPRVLKVVLNMGLGIEGNEQKKLKNLIEDMSLITGQRPVQTRFRKSISNFKTRKTCFFTRHIILFYCSKLFEFVSAFTTFIVIVWHLKFSPYVLATDDLTNFALHDFLNNEFRVSIFFFVIVSSYTFP